MTDSFRVSRYESDQRHAERIAAEWRALGFVRVTVRDVKPSPRYLGTIAIRGTCKDMATFAWWLSVESKWHEKRPVRSRCAKN